MATVEGKRRGRLRVHRPVVYAVVGLVLLLAAAKFWGPLGTARRQADELARLRREKTALEQDRAQLQHLKDQLASDDGVETAARREGYLKSGDRRIVFVKQKEKGRPKQAPPGAAQPKQK